MVGQPDGKKNFEDMYNCLDLIPACDRRTDGRTDRQTDILRRHSSRYAYASRGKNYVAMRDDCLYVGAQRNSRRSDIMT